MSLCCAFMSSGGQGLCTGPGGQCVSHRWWKLLPSRLGPHYFLLWSRCSRWLHRVTCVNSVPVAAVVIRCTTVGVCVSGAWACTHTGWESLWVERIISRSGWRCPDLSLGSGSGLGSYAGPESLTKIPQGCQTSQRSKRIDTESRWLQQVAPTESQPLHFTKPSSPRSPCPAWSRPDATPCPAQQTDLQVAGCSSAGSGSQLGLSACRLILRTRTGLRSFPGAAVPLPWGTSIPKGLFWGFVVLFAPWLGPTPPNPCPDKPCPSDLMQANIHLLVSDHSTGIWRELLFLNTL